MNTYIWRLSPLLLGSGFCALVYQMAWMRELRLIFGGTTAANSAVLAVFMGGLGLGAWILGKRSDQCKNPLLFYAQLEVLIALSVAVTPALLGGVRHAYIFAGGNAATWQPLAAAATAGEVGPVALGSFGGTLLRLLFSSLVLLIPTFLMGGTLPAVARAAEAEDSPSRSRTAFLYGINTLGAVAGCLGATFFLFEHLGTHLTLWSACGLNLLIGILAWKLARSASVNSVGAAAGPSQPTPRLPFQRQGCPASGSGEGGRESGSRSDRSLPTVSVIAPALVAAAAALVGFVFFLMELVWYRMLIPLLGGTVFAFGLILAVALLGIGLGGISHALFMKKRAASPSLFAATCILEATLIFIPYLMGDRIAVLALFWRSWGEMGFAGYVLSWTAITAIVVLPAAWVAGIQFPLLISLLGRGRREVGSHVGVAYGWNTAGSIVGALAGGFGLLPLLGATGCWRLSAGILFLLGWGVLLADCWPYVVGAGFIPSQITPRAGINVPAPFLPTPYPAPTLARHLRRATLAIPLGLIVLLGFMAVLTTATGPTAVWRHGGIGTGRNTVPASLSRNGLQKWINDRRREVFWETEGTESGLALKNTNGLLFVQNGKADGNVKTEAPTHVMGGLLGAILHPQPRQAMVIGLGTGTSAGWLGAVPSIERVDVVELEPRIVDVARRCAVANLDVLSNPKVHIEFGDGREALLTTRRRYDLIFSEPSNLFRTGVANLFTREYYEAVSQRLEEGGIFLQWVPAYEIDNQTIRTLYATLASVFPSVESWQTLPSDLLLVASHRTVPYSIPALRTRIEQEPFKTALAAVWRTNDLEGFLAHFVARAGLARTIAPQGTAVNTDDRNIVEFRSAKNLGRKTDFSIRRLRDSARPQGMNRPFLSGGSAPFDKLRTAPSSADGPDWTRIEREQTSIAASMEFQDPAHPPGGAPQADRRVILPLEADVLRAEMLSRQGGREEAVMTLENVFQRYRFDPWPSLKLMARALNLAKELSRQSIASKKPEHALRLFRVLQKPFSLFVLNEKRLATLFAIASHLQRPELCVEVFAELEPHVPWQRQLLLSRSQCYTLTVNPRARLAAAEWAEFLKNERGDSSKKMEPVYIIEDGDTRAQVPDAGKAVSSDKPVPTTPPPPRLHSKPPE